MSIIVKTQAELDKIPLDTNEQIRYFGIKNNIDKIQKYY